MKCRSERTSSLGRKKADVQCTYFFIHFLVQTVDEGAESRAATPSNFFFFLFFTKQKNTNTQTQNTLLRPLLKVNNELATPVVTKHK